MRLQSQIIGLNRTDSEIIDFAVDRRPNRALFRALRRRVEQLNLEIEKRSKEVDELKITLRVVLRKKNEDIAACEERMLCSLKQMLMPYLAVLENATLNTKHRQCVRELKKSIENIAFPFSPSFLRECAILTPVEIRVAGMIKQGKTTKEIAEIFCLSTRTIESHRRNIRKKLGLNNRKINLMTHFMVNPASGLCR